MGSESVSLLNVPAMAISSTDCRARVAAGKPVWYLVPDGVVQYINKYGLYRGPERLDAGASSAGPVQPPAGECASSPAFAPTESTETPHSAHRSTA